VFEILMAGGWAMAPILLCSVLVLGITAERLWALRRSSVVPPTLGAEVREYASQRQLTAEHLDALAKNSPLGQVMSAALRGRAGGRDAVRERVEDAGRHVMHEMERFLNTLGTIALISPLLGLLGTVMGMIRMFLAIVGSGVGDASKLAGGIGEALVCTAAGLVVAIPAYILHRYFRGRVADLGIALEREVTGLLDDLDAKAAAAPVAPSAPAPKRATR
jgi:biopolymer transport protein ExbB